MSPLMAAASAAWDGFVVLVWAVPFVLLAVLFAVRVHRSRHFGIGSELITSGQCFRLFSELCQRLRIRRKIDLREHSRPIIPLTCGMFQPTIVLPELANDWDQPMQPSVLLHELTHIRRRDVFWLLVGRLACTMYWFHPLVWFALRQLRQCSEHACDAAVIDAGERASDYAEQLLEVARLCNASHTLSLSAAMVDDNSLQHRVESLFDKNRSHAPIKRATGVMWLLTCSAVLAVVASLHSVRMARRNRDRQPQNKPWIAKGCPNGLTVWKHSRCRGKFKQGRFLA